MAEIDAEKQAKLDKFVFNAISGDTPNFQSAQNWMAKGGKLSNLVNNGTLNATPLHHAVNGGWFKTVEWLVDNGADVNALDQHGRTPAHYLAKVFQGLHAEWLKMADALVKKGNLDLNVQDVPTKKTVFHYFPEATNQPLIASIQLAQRLLEKVDNVNLQLKDIEGSTQLATAVRRKEKGLISLYEDYIAKHGGANSSAGASAGVSKSSGAAGSAEEIKVMKELLLVLAEAVGDSVGSKRAGEIRELSYKLSHM